jgi:hypothetical protein
MHPLYRCTLIKYWSNPGDRLIVVYPARLRLLQVRELERDVHTVEVARQVGCQETGESPLETGRGTVDAVRRTKRRRMHVISSREAQKRVPERL